MPWTLTIERDSDKNDVGSATATFVESGTVEPVFTKTERLKLTIAERDAFFARCYNQRNKWRERLAWQNNKKSETEALLNSNDPNP